MNYFNVTFIIKGKKVDEIIEAENKIDVLDKITNNPKRYKGIPIKIVPTNMPFDKKMEYLKTTIKLSLTKKKLDYVPFISALRQLSVLAYANISLKDGFANIAEHSTNEFVKELFSKCAEGIDNGLNASVIFEEYKDHLGVLAVAMLKLGEQTGDLGSALENLADIYENIEENRQKFKKAMRYPIITLSAMGIAFTILIMFVVPKFKSIFKQLNGELPLPTKILLNLEYIFSHYGVVVVGIAFIIIVLHKFTYKINQNYKYKVDKLTLKIKLIGPIIEFASISRFLLVLKELSKSGIPLIDALNTANGILENAVLKEKIDNIIRDINQGKSFTTGLKENQLLDNITLQMIAAGEDSGALDEMLANASDYYKTQFDQIVDGIGDAIEPIMMAVIGALVLLLALGIFLPIWNLASAAKA